MYLGRRSAPRADTPMTEQRTILLLGAGASKASRFELPTMQGFFAHNAAHIPDAMTKMLMEMYGMHSKLADWNLEDALSFLYASAERATTWGRYSPEPGCGFGDLLKVVRARLSIAPEEHCPLHVRLLDATRPRTVVTLNYDLVADQSFDSWAKQQADPQLARHPRLKLLSLVGRMPVAGPDPIGLHSDDAKGGFFLKLHGSLDWVVCSDPRCPNAEEIYVGSLNGYAETHEPGAPCGRCGASLETLIIPPLPVKSIETRHRLRLLWRLAMNELALADRVVVMGLSFAASDFDLRWLIRQARFGRRKEMSLAVINPSRKDRDRAIGLFADVTSVREYDSLDEFLAVA